MTSTNRFGFFQRYNISNFSEDILMDYENSLNIFLETDSGAVFESGRDDGTPRFLYTECTGYAILDFIFLYTITRNDKYLENAKKSASWIINQAIDSCGGVKTRYFFENDENPKFLETSFYGRRIYSFDTAICLKSFVALYNLTNEKVYLELSKRMGKFLLSMVADTGRVSPIYNAKDNNYIEDDRSVWSKQFGPFHSKVAESLFDLYTVTMNLEYLMAAKSICRAVLKFQKPSGNFETSLALTELHPHCYAAEGLLYVGLKTRNKLFIDAARNAVEWALSKSYNGEIAQSFNSNTGMPLSNYRTDALAQMVILSMNLLREDELNDEYAIEIEKLVLKILEAKSVNKYFEYGYYEMEHGGSLKSNTRSYWTNMFCLQGLYEYYLMQTLAHTWVVILAGGRGARFWPIACETMPKPLSVVLLNGHSLLQETIRRYTNNNLIKPEKILILCGDKAKDKADEQLRLEHIPSENILVEKEPKGTVPAIQVVFDELEKSQNIEDSNFIVSTADDIIEPHDLFQRALISALFTARENECLVSIGKPVDHNVYDNRFGYMTYNKKINSYQCYKVDEFIEKPSRSEFENLIHNSNNMAWECGTVIFKGSYFRQVASSKDGNDLAKNLLSKASTWQSKKVKSINMAVSTLDARTSFEDLGMLGLNLYNYFKDNPNHMLGSGNVGLGYPTNINLYSNNSNNLVVSDNVPIRITGLSGYLIIDNSWTNTTVIMPLSDVAQLSNFYYKFLDSEKYKPFIIGGVDACHAPSIVIVENSPKVKAVSENGLVIAYNCGELLIDKRKDSLLIVGAEDGHLDSKYLPDNFIANLYYSIKFAKIKDLPKKIVRRFSIVL